MKLGIFSDIHLSHNDMSINQNNAHNILDSLQWAYQTFKDNNCDLVINSGDFLDSDVIDAEANYIIKTVFKKNNQKQIILLGNHEMKDAEGKYNSLNILDNYPNITVIDKLKTIDAGNDCTLVFQPYSHNDMKPLLDKLDSIKGRKVLFSHLTYSNVPNVFNPAKGEIDYNWVKDRVDIIFNGHIHIGLESEKYVQVGILTGLNFSDEYAFHNPGIIIYDTDTNKFTRIENPKAILYKKTTYNKLNLKNLERTRLRVDCPSDKVEGLTEKLEKLGVLSYKIKVIVDEKTEQDKQVFELYTSPSKALLDFIKTEKSIYTDEQLTTFIGEYIQDKKVKTEEGK